MTDLFTRRPIATAPPVVRRLAGERAQATKSRAISWVPSGGGGAYVYFEPARLAYFPAREIRDAEATR